MLVSGFPKRVKPGLEKRDIMSVETTRRVLNDDAEFGRYVQEKALEYASRISPGVYDHPIHVALAFEVTIGAPTGEGVELPAERGCVCSDECAANRDGSIGCITICRGLGCLR
jgi:hypothetical protein